MLVVLISHGWLLISRKGIYSFWLGRADQNAESESKIWIFAVPDEIESHPFVSTGDSFDYLIYLISIIFNIDIF